VLGFNGAGPQGGFVVAFTFESKESTTIASGLDSAVVTSDRKKVMLVRGQSLSIIDAGAGAGAHETPVSLAPNFVSIDPVAEWKEVFEESWRMAHDLYYDSGMHGVYIFAVHKK